MDDLIGRLLGPSPSIPAMRDAAREIERLQAGLARHVERVCALTAERDALQARIDGSPVAFWSDEEGPLSAEAVTDIGPCRNDVRVALVVLEDGK